jgi:hypothetical protein
MRHFFISLGVTCLVCVVLFLYFRNRIGRMEQKVDLMFQLIQEYEQNKIIHQNHPRNDTQSVPTVFPGTQMGGTEHRVEANLINVSDDESDYSDSDEVSDEEDSLLNIKETVVGENIKSISLSGAEIESIKVETGDDLDDISDFDETNMDDMITLEEVNNDEIEVEEQEVEKQEVEKQEVEKQEDADEHQEEIEEIEVKDDKPLSDRTVKELKQLAEEKGFTNYKGLRKNKLVELLATSQ